MHFCYLIIPESASFSEAIASKVGGGGGGRPNMAQAGGKNPAGIPDAIASVKDALSGKTSLQNNSNQAC